MKGRHFVKLLIMLLAGIFIISVFSCEIHFDTTGQIRIHNSASILDIIDGVSVVDAGYSYSYDNVSDIDYGESITYTVDGGYYYDVHIRDWYISGYDYYHDYDVYVGSGDIVDLYFDGYSLSE